MFELRVKTSFSAAHHLNGYSGNCARVHGHTWQVEAVISAQALNQIGMAVDFRVVRDALNSVVQKWDHQDLNQLEEFKSANPTAEVLARAAYAQLREIIMQKCGDQSGIDLDRVIVWESDTCSSSYRE